MSERAPRVACKRESVVVTRFAPGEEIYAYDHAGRLFTAWRGHRLYRRALDGQVLEKHTDRRGRRPVTHRRFLDRPERAAFIDEAALAAGEALTAFRAGSAEVLWSLPVPEDRRLIEELVTAAARFDARAADTDSRRFDAAYTPVPILPPDRYLALVVQVTEGCHWNRCTFCSFYRDRPFRVKPLPEFRAHIDAVTDFFGRGLRLRRGIFLGDANALLLPAADLAPRLDHLASRLPDHARDLAAFIDVFTGHKRREAEFTALRARGLRRVYLGLESGCDDLLVFLNKPQTAADGIELVHAGKAAGLSVGVIIMAGVGARAFWTRHVDATIEALGRMRLGGGDLVYVSAFAAPAEGPYAERARAAGVEPLTGDQVADQVDELLLGARRVVGAGTRVAPYDIEEFLY